MVENLALLRLPAVFKQKCSWSRLRPVHRMFWVFLRQVWRFNQTQIPTRA